MHLPIVIHHCPTATRGMKERRETAMKKELGKLNMPHLLPWYSLPTGSMASGATVFYKCLAALLAQKWDNPYSATMSWLRCRLAFSLLQSAITCIRGARSRPGHAIRHSPIPLIRSEAELLDED